MFSRTNAVLIIIDIQGNLAQAMYNKENLFANAIKLIKGFKILNLPVILTEQTPQKLGQTIPQIAAQLDAIKPIAKEAFSCWANVQFREQLEALNRRHVVLLGIESHVCIYQSALDLIANGYNVHPVADAISSRTKENRDIGLSAMKSGGAHLAGTEMVLFELLRTAADPQAKDIFKIVK